MPWGMEEGREPCSAWSELMLALRGVFSVRRQPQAFVSVSAVGIRRGYFLASPGRASAEEQGPAVSRAAAARGRVLLPNPTG